MEKVKETTSNNTVNVSNPITLNKKIEINTESKPAKKVSIKVQKYFQSLIKNDKEVDTKINIKVLKSDLPLNYRKSNILKFENIQNNFSESDKFLRNNTEKNNTYNNFKNNIKVSSASQNKDSLKSVRTFDINSYVKRVSNGNIKSGSNNYNQKFDNISKAGTETNNEFNIEDRYNNNATINIEFRDNNYNYNNSYTDNNYEYPNSKEEAYKDFFY